MFVYVLLFFAPFVFFAFHKRRDGTGFLARLFGALRLDTPVGSNTEATENPGFLARLFGAFGLGDGVSTSAEAREARRKRIEARTGTVDDYRAEIAAQERELTAAVKEKGKVDDEIETAKAEIATREAKHPSAIMVELKDELARLATSIQLETDKQTVYLNQAKTFTTHIAAMRADIETLKSQRQALEHQMGK